MSPSTINPKQMKNILPFLILIVVSLTSTQSIAQGAFFTIGLQGGGNCAYTISGTYSAMTDSTINGAFTAVVDPATGLYSVSIGVGVSSLFVTACAYPTDPNCGTETCTSSVINFNAGFVPSINIVIGSSTDSDNDGFTVDNGDCDDSNAGINPYAIDICGDSIDNNCNGLVDDSNCDGSLLIYGQVTNANAATEVFIIWSDSLTGTTGMDSILTAADGSFSYSIPGGIPMYYLFVQACIYNCSNEYICTYAYITPNQTLTLQLDYCVVLTDSDNDGYFNDVDCDDFNSTINPGSAEVCGDFTDNDCDGLFDEDCGSGCSPNIVLVTDSMYPGLPAYTVYILNLDPTGVAPFTYQWNLGDGTFSNEPYPTNTYPSTGSYTICLTVISADSCSSEMCITFSVDSMGNVSGGGFPMSPVFLNVIPSLDAVSVNEMKSGELATKVFPNPASSQIQVSWNPDITAHSIELSDVNGRVVLHRNLQTSQSNVMLNVEALSVGLYNVILRSNDGSVNTNRILISR